MCPWFCLRKLWKNSTFFLHDTVFFFELLFWQALALAVVMGFRRMLRHFSDSIHSDVESQRSAEFLEPSTANRWSSRAPLLNSPGLF